MSLIIMMLLSIPILIGGCRAFGLSVLPRSKLRHNINFNRDSIKKLLADAKTGQYRLETKRHRDHIHTEIYEGVALLRNLISTGADRRLSTDGLIEQLATLGGHLRPHYEKCLTILRRGKSDDMIAYFTSEMDFAIADDYIRLIASWDYVAPEKFKTSLVNYQSNLKEMRITNLKKKDEVISDLIYFPIVINALFIFMNFIFVGYFIEQKNMIGALFF
ncbi:MAG: hypothetical protein LBN22_03250 [Clostridiales Family XIII bacterium]|jgi:methyltransferase-like protein|nr:hypothetical protein [Clostridiales Family XIII bacterium]